MYATLFLYRIVDICDELDVRLLTQKLKKLKVRPLKLRHFTPAYLNFSVPPVEMDAEPWWLSDEKLEVQTQFKFYSLGTVTIRFAINFEVDDDTSLFNRAQSIINNEAFAVRTETAAREVCALVSQELGIAARPTYTEDYNILWISGKAELARGKWKVLAAQFLRNEFLPLSATEQEEAWKHHFSYTEDDVTVVDWDRAVTISPEPEDDVWDVLEYANLQLVELRYYEDELDKRLAEVYNLARQRFAFLNFFRTPRLLRRTLRLFLDFSSVEEKINGFLRLTGDEFLSRVYLAAGKRLNINNQQQQLKEKLNDTRELYQTLADEFGAFRGEFLEIIVIILIVLEILMYFWGK